jgi:hypothetical protein
MNLWELTERLARTSLITEEGGAKELIPSWALNLIKLGWVACQISANSGNRVLLVLVVPSRRYVSSLLAAGASMYEAERKGPERQFQTGDYVYFIDGGRIARAKYMGPDSEYDGLEKLVETKTNGETQTIWRESWRLFPDVFGLRPMLQDLNAASGLRKSIPTLAEVRQAGRPKIWVLTSGPSVVEDAESLRLELGEGMASLRQLLLWRDDKSGGMGLTRPWRGYGSPAYDEIRLAILDGPDSLKHLERPMGGSSRMTGDGKSVIAVLDESDFFRDQEFIRNVVTEWGGASSLPPNSDCLLEILADLPGSAAIHCFDFQAGEENA